MESRIIMDKRCVTVYKEKKKQRRKKETTNRSSRETNAIINSAEWRIGKKKRSLVKVAYRKVPLRSPFRIHLAIIRQRRVISYGACT